MDIVSELLGNGRISITEESYGKVVKQKDSEQMRRLNERLNNYTCYMDSF